MIKSVEDAPEDYVLMHKDEMKRLWVIEDAALHFYRSYYDLLGYEKKQKPMVALICETREHYGLMVGALQELRLACQQKSPYYPNGELQTIV